jgi:hypothetical protein
VFHTKKRSEISKGGECWEHAIIFSSTLLRRKTFPTDFRAPEWIRVNLTAPAGR